MVFVSTAGASGAAEFKTVSTEGFGCLALNDFNRAVDFANQNDIAAFKKFIGQKVPSGECRSLHKGQAVFEEQTSGDGRICVRPKGDIDCVWTDRAIIE
ncbi:MAG: hypothetical protein E5W95_18210 [Mesorhizobium sp.]|nr:MAG: hypothetical protein E5W95_18210 [Mesorhizobium sp.]